MTEEMRGAGEAKTEFKKRKSDDVHSTLLTPQHWFAAVFAFLLIQDVYRHTGGK